jgi:predicted methyltransferase
MRRISSLSLLSLFLVTACDDKSSTGEEKSASVTAKKADDAKADDAKADDAKADDAKADDAKGGDEDEAKKDEERKKKLDEAYAKLEEWKTKEAARWTDEVETKVKELVETEFKDIDAALTAIIASPHRQPDNVARDEYRHPVETLKFFGIEPGMTVVEVGPGGGWYTEILAPLVAAKGKLVVNQGDPNADKYAGGTIYAKRFQAFVESSETAYGKIEAIIQKDPDKLDLGEPESADMVLIIRGLHGRVNRDQLPMYLKAAHDVLKSGGTLGIVQHRAKDDADPKESAEKGYLPEPWLISEIEKAGFELEEKSELNANPKDTKDYEEGVWTLPPTLTLGDKDKDKYVGIGESDRMTLRFKKK